jgi:hypothetical protein
MKSPSKSFSDAFKRALQAVKKSTRAKRSTMKLAITRYGYLIVDWPVIEDNLSESGGGAVMLGEADELTISRGNHPLSKNAHAENLERLKADATKILGPRFHITEKNGYLFVGQK